MANKDLSVLTLILSKNGKERGRICVRDMPNGVTAKSQARERVEHYSGRYKVEVKIGDLT